MHFPDELNLRAAALDTILIRISEHGGVPESSAVSVVIDYVFQ